MKYRNEKELIIDQLESLVCRGLNCTVFPANAKIEGSALLTSDMKPLSNDPEIARLFLARKVLLEGNNTAASEGNGTAAPNKELTVKGDLVDQFKKAYDFLCGLRGEKDYGKAIDGLIDVGIFLITIVTALSANEASRNSKH